LPRASVGINPGTESRRLVSAVRLYNTIRCTALERALSAFHKARNVRRILIMGGSMPPCRLSRRKFDYEMVHSEVLLNKYVVSIAPFSTLALVLFFSPSSLISLVSLFVLVVRRLFVCWPVGRK